VQQDQGLNVTFYSWIGVKRGASIDQINKAYRKRAALLHPDKARSTFINKYATTHEGKKPSTRQVNAFAKEASERFARFGVVANVLRGENRERYDYFLKNGFPKWRGTGYYYTRFRPGLGSVLFGMFVIFGGAAHYGALYVSHKRHKDFVDRYIKHARRLAWGDNLVIPGIPGVDALNGNATGADTSPPSADEGQSMQWNRKQKRMAEKESRKASKNPKAARTAKKEGISTPVEAELTSGPIGAKKRVQAENGKVLIVDSVGNVYVEEVTEEGDHVELLLDVSLCITLFICDIANMNIA
jgi:curved DNA-binding protein CbpA